MPLDHALVIYGERALCNSQTEESDLGTAQVLDRLGESGGTCVIVR